MKTLNAKHNQTLLDIALQEYGGIEGAAWLVEDNQDSVAVVIDGEAKQTLRLYGIGDNLNEGDILFVRESNINSNKQVYLSPYEIATADGTRGEGIGFWQLENDFVVS